MLKALLLKEILVLKKTMWGIFIFVVFYLGFGILVGTNMLVSGIFVLVVMTSLQTSISYDEYYHWDRYALAMPVARRDLVQAKYLLVLLLTCLIFLLVLLCLQLSGRFDWPTSLILSFGFAIAGLIYGSVLLLMIYRLGPQRGGWVGSLVAGCTGVMIALVGLCLDFNQGPPWQMPHFYPLIGGVGLCVFFLFGASYLLSVRIFERREL